MFGNAPKISTCSLQFESLHDNGSTLNKNFMHVANNNYNRNSPLENMCCRMNFILKEALRNFNSWASFHLKYHALLNQIHFKYQNAQIKPSCNCNLQIQIFLCAVFAIKVSIIPPMRYLAVKKLKIFVIFTFRPHFLSLKTFNHWWNSFTS